MQAGDSADIYVREKPESRLRETCEGSCCSSTLRLRSVFARGGNAQHLTYYPTGPIGRVETFGSCRLRDEPRWAYAGRASTVPGPPAPVAAKIAL